MGLFGRNRQVEQNPAYTAKSALHPRADSHTSSFDNKQKLSQSMTEPLYEVRHLESVRRYAPAPAPSYHGPHFEKGPSQEEIWNTRQTKEPWQFDKKVDEVAFRQEYCHRAPTFQQPVQEHQYSAPYEVRPIPWTKQMSAEYDEYKILDGSNKVNRAGVREANKTKVGRNYVPTEDHGRAIEEGISYAIAGRTMAKMRKRIFTSCIICLILILRF